MTYVYNTYLQHMLQSFWLPNALVFVSVSKNHTRCHSWRTGQGLQLSPHHPPGECGWIWDVSGREAESTPVVVSG